MAQLQPLDIGRNFVAGQQVKEQRERSKLHDLLAVKDANQREQMNDLSIEQKKQQLTNEQFKRDLTGMGLLGSAIKGAKTEEEAAEIFNQTVPLLAKNGFDTSGLGEFRRELIPVLGRSYHLAKQAGVLDDQASIPSGLREFNELVNMANLSEEDKARAATNRLGLTSKAASGGTKFGTFTGADGKERLYRGDPTTAQIEIYDGTKWISAENNNTDSPEVFESRTEEDSASKVAAGKQSGGDIEQARTVRIETGFDAAKGIPTVLRGLELLDRVETGGPEALALSVKQRLGVEGADEGELANVLGKAVLSQLRPTFGAQFTEKEGERLNRIEAGFGKSAATNKRLLNELYQVAVQEANQAIQDAESRGDYDTASAIRAAMNHRFDETRDIFGEIQSAGSQKEGGQLMIDANGNKAMVYPDGTFEEVQ